MEAGFERPIAREALSEEGSRGDRTTVEVVEVPFDIREQTGDALSSN